MGAVGVAVVDIGNAVVLRGADNDRAQHPLPSMRSAADATVNGGRYAVDAPLDTNAFVAPKRVAAMQRTSLRKDTMMCTGVSSPSPKSSVLRQPGHWSQNHNPFSHLKTSSSSPSPSSTPIAGCMVAALIIFASSLIIIRPVDGFVPPAASHTLALATNNDIIFDLTTTTTTSTTTKLRKLSSSLSAIRRGGGRRPDGGRKVAEFIPPMNDEIIANEIRVNVLTKDGKDESLGVMTKAEALAKAKELGGLDLILINDNSIPPVCKIADYSKYRYSQEKKRKEKAKNSKATEIKEVKMSYIIGDHDYDVRLKAAMKFIKQGNRVKATVQFRGREVQHDNLGVELLIRLASDLEDVANMEGKPRREGRTMGSILTPRAEVVKALNDAKRLREREKKKAKEESLKKRMEAMDAKQLAAMAAAPGGMEGGIQELLDELEAEMAAEEDDEDDDDDDDMDDDDFDDDADLDELLGSAKVADDLFA